MGGYYIGGNYIGEDIIDIGGILKKVPFSSKAFMY